jgi:cytochrome P450
MCAGYQPNLLLAVLWASQANSMPALHWSLAFLLLPEQAAARQKVLAELKDAADKQRQQQQQEEGQQIPGGQEKDSAQQQQQQQLGVDNATAAAMVQLAMDKSSYVSRCVAEAVRLRLHSIAIRYVAVQDLVLPRSTGSTGVGSTSDATVDGSSSGSGIDQLEEEQQQQQLVRVPRGSVLCICPVESHHDSRLFSENPWGFNPDRAAVQGLQPGTVVPSLAGMGYGGGFWR